MGNEKDTEALMLKYFPTCPLCGADKGYDVSGFAKSFVQCRSCKAKWESTDFIKCQELKQLELWDLPYDGKGASLKRKKFPVEFWQDSNAVKSKIDVEKTEALAKNQSESRVLFTTEASDETLQQQNREDLTDLRRYEADKGMGGFLTHLTGTAIENAMVSLLHAIVIENKVLIRQNELILRSLKEAKPLNANNT